MRAKEICGCNIQVWWAHVSDATPQWLNTLECYTFCSTHGRKQPFHSHLPLLEQLLMGLLRTDLALSHVLEVDPQPLNPTLTC